MKNNFHRACAALAVVVTVMVLVYVGLKTVREARAQQPDVHWSQERPRADALPVHVACAGFAFDGWRNPDRADYFTLAGEVVSLPSTSCLVIFRKAKP